jgi:GT2 family glycosyltransferase
MIRPSDAVCRIARSPAVETFDLDVGIVYTHERQWMGPLVSTLKASADRVDTRLILVDNDSDEGVDSWRYVVPETLVLHNSTRLGYAANLNRILTAATARYVLLMNTDMFFDPRQQCLARMIEFMDAHPGCGLAGCRLLHADGNDARAARRFQNLPIILARRLGLGRVMPSTLDRYFYREHDIHDSFDCDWLSGCFMMIRREAFEQVGLFDESFGKYFEDVDMCLRMARNGWRVMYCGGTSCYHIEQRASQNLFSADAWRHVRAYLYWLNKWGYASHRQAVPPLQAVTTV